VAWLLRRPGNQTLYKFLFRWQWGKEWRPIIVAGAAQAGGALGLSRTRAGGGLAGGSAARVSNQGQRLAQ